MADTTEARWQGRFEVLAALAAGAAGSLLAGAALNAWAQADEVSRNQVFSDGVDLLDVVRASARAVSPLMAGLLVVAYVLVLQGPGERVGRLGRATLWALVGLGLAFAAAAAGAAADLLVNEQTDGRGLGRVVFGDSLTGGMERVGAALPYAASAALCGYVAWLAWSALPATRPGSDAVGDAEEAGPTDGPHAPGEAEEGHDPGDDAEVEAG
ncbi:MAG: hypothetical protein KDA97_06055 [Acidimicrobiales bacterium]|nr:hypothetical protein [Acidimicrobiales bacterium]